MTNTTILLSEEFAQYNKEMAKRNVYGSTLDSMARDVENGSIVIEMTEKRYKKNGRKNFPAKPTEEHTEVIGARNYACYISSIGFFGDRVGMSYTKYGRIPTTITSISWGTGDTKVVREFYFRMK